MPLSGEIRIAENRLDDRLNAALRRQRGLVNDLAGLVESQTQRRIDTEKESPDGQAWDDWSAAYAATRGPGKSLLQDTNALLNAVEAHAVGDSIVEVHTGNLPYAAAQHHGRPDVNIPARPFIGLSPANRAEIAQLVRDQLGGV